jgi:beta-glucosidase
MNDQEENRCDMLCTWSNEQAIREIYLKPFEICVKNVEMCAVMSSFNYIGNRWAGGSSSLMKTVLRDEWGFNGFALTDYFGVYGYMSSDQAIRNGTDCMLVNYPTATNNVQFRDTNGAQQAMRDASRNILYTVVNSRAYAPENLKAGMASWKKLMIALDVIFAALMIALMCIFIKNYGKNKKAAAADSTAQA